MAPARMTSLETCARATRSAFGFDESEFEPRPVAPVRASRVLSVMLGLTALGGALVHQFGWTRAVASLSGWRGWV